VTETPEIQFIFKGERGKQLQQQLQVELQQTVKKVGAKAKYSVACMPKSSYDSSSFLDFLRQLDLPPDQLLVLVVDSFSAHWKAVIEAGDELSKKGIIVLFVSASMTDKLQVRRIWGFSP
jgi:hypothetical protein